MQAMQKRTCRIALLLKLHRLKPITLANASARLSQAYKMIFVRKLGRPRWRRASLCRFYEDAGLPVSNSYPRERTFFGAEIDAAFGMTNQFMPADRKKYRKRDGL